MPEISPSERALLCQNGWFGELPVAVRNDLLDQCSRHRLNDGQRLYAAADAPTGWYAILTGAIRVSNVTADGREVILAYLEPGAWLGELSLIDGLPRSHNGHAVGATDYLLLPPAAFATACRDHPALPMALLKMQAARMRLMFAAIEDLNTLPLDARLAKQLLNLAGTYGTAVADGIEIGLKLPQEELAQLLGASRQRINQELKAWERAGWLTARYGKLIVRRADALRAIALR